MLDWQPKAPYTAEQLLEILRILRDPENGCPWDKVQTHASIRKNFLEETCEVLEAIDADDPVLMQEELGDVLMQVAFHAVMEEELQVHQRNADDPRWQGGLPQAGGRDHSPRLLILNFTLSFFRH